MTDFARMFVVWLFFLATLPGLVSSTNLGMWFGSGTTTKAPAATPQDFTTALAIAIKNEQQSEQKLQRVLVLVNSYKSLPSCSRLAWSSLITSCSDLEEQSPDSSKPLTSELTLDKVRSKFAARLAVCELAAVSKEIVPRQCVSFLDYVDDDKPFGNRYLDGDSAQHDVCLKGLHTDGRAWTSYSNAKQNAALICEVSRKFMEREDMVNFQQSMLEVARQGLQTHTLHVNSLQNLTTTLDLYINQLELAVLDNMDKAAQFTAFLQEHFASLAQQAQSTGSTMEIFEATLRSSIAEMAANAKAHGDNYHMYFANIREIFDTISDAVKRQKSDMEEQSLEFRTALAAEVVQYSETVQANLDLARWSADYIAEHLQLTSKDVAIVREHLGQSDTLVLNINQHLNTFHSSLDAMQVHQEEALNNTIERYEQMFTGMGFLGAGSMMSFLTWFLGAVASWFHDLPAVIVLGSYFCMFTFTALLGAVLGRKLAAIPFALITAPARIMWDFISSAPWPVPAVITILSSFFAFVEHPAISVMRWSTLAFNLDDLALALCISILLSTYLIISFYKDGYKDGKTAADEALIGEFGYAEKSNDLIFSDIR